MLWVVLWRQALDLLRTNKLVLEGFAISYTSCDHHHHHHQLLYLDVIIITIIIIKWSTLMWSVSIFCQSPSHHLLYHFISQSQTRGLPENFGFWLCSCFSTYCFIMYLFVFLADIQETWDSIIFQWFLSIFYPPSQKVKYIWRRILFKKRTKWLSSVEIFKHPNFLLWIPESTESLFFFATINITWNQQTISSCVEKKHNSFYNWHFHFIREMMFFVWLYSKLFHSCQLSTSFLFINGAKSTIVRNVRRTKRRTIILLGIVQFFWTLL